MLMLSNVFPEFMIPRIMAHIFHARWIVGDLGTIELNWRLEPGCMAAIELHML